jgi:hypothetical protein
VSTDELAFARESIAALLARHDDADVWEALDEGGWLDLVPAQGHWENAAFVAEALDVIGAEAHSIAYAPHVAATATFAEMGVDAPLRPLALALDPVRRVDGARVRLWGEASAATALVDLGEDGLAVVSAAAWNPAQPGDDLLEPVMVYWADIDLSAATPLEMDRAGLARHRARVAYVLAAEAAGAVRSAALRTVEYLKARRAFGVTLSSFQALQHRAVDIYAESLLADALVSEATARMRSGDDASHAAWAAKAFVGDRGTWAMENAIQLHGGIGFTWELGLHFGLRRTQRARLLGGAVEQTAREVLASRSAQRAARLTAVTDWSERALPDKAVLQ